MRELSADHTNVEKKQEFHNIFHHWKVFERRHFYTNC